MSFINVFKRDEIAIVTISRGKVNALTGEVVDELCAAFEQLEKDSTTKAVILSGSGKFFSYGFDVPEFCDYSREQLEKFLVNFTSFCAYLFPYPKPIIAAINGHATAGGCILAMLCDYRLMVTGKAKIGLNEVTFGASIFASSVAMLKHLVGGRNAEKVLLTGAMFTAQKARAMGLVDMVVDEEASLARAAQELAVDFATRSGPAFASLKRLLRDPVVEEMVKCDPTSIAEFLDIWYSPATREKLNAFEIRG